MTRRKHRPKDVVNERGWRYAGWSGRPNLVEKGHGAWSRESCFARNSKGWQPDINTLQQGHLCPVPWGPLGAEPPPNASGDPGSYNQDLWPDEKSVGLGLQYLGYRGTNGRALLRDFQHDWNYVVQRINSDPSFKAIAWGRVPTGHLTADSNIGPRTLNAMEIATINQDHDIPWKGLLHAARNPMQTQGRHHIYSAK